MAKQVKTSWSQVKAQLKHWDNPQLTGLIQDLFGHSQENRDFLTTRLLAEAGDGAALAPYRKRIEAAFYSRSGWPRLKLRDGRKAIRDYRAASADPAGALELMLAYVETGTRFTCDFGDIDDAFYGSLCSVLHEIEELLRNDEGRPLYGSVKDRLADLARQAGNIGWGYGDHVGEVVTELARALGETDAPSAP